MKLTAKTDIEAPIGFVYAALTDFPAWEREALQRGAEVERPANSPATGKDAVWQVKFRYRGRLRKLTIRVLDATLDERLVMGIDSTPVEGSSQMDLVSLSARRTRLRVTLDMRPKTLAARLFVNALRVARRKVEMRFEKRIGQLAARIEDLHQRSRATA